MKNKVVLVTGGSSGLGKSIAEEFASNNYNVIFTYLNHENDANNIKLEIENKYKVKCDCFKCDLSNEDDINELYKQVFNIYDNISVLVNNAAISIDTTFNMKTKKNFMKILDVNLVGTFLLTRLFADKMFKNKKGKIINISSNNAIDAYYEYSLDYDASKSALINLTHNLANHYAPYLNVNCVCPGWINTNMNKNLSDGFKLKEIDKILLNRFAEPNEIANLVYFLASDDANYINDSIIKIDGGIKHE